MSRKHIAVLLFSVLVRVKKIFSRMPFWWQTHFKKSHCRVVAFHPEGKGSTQDLHMPVVEREPQMSEAFKKTVLLVNYTLGIEIGMLVPYLLV